MAATAPDRPAAARRASQRARASVREITLDELAAHGARVPAAPLTTELDWYARRDGRAVAVVRRDHRTSSYEYLVLAGTEVVARRSGISDRCAACSQAVAALEELPN